MKIVFFILSIFLISNLLFWKDALSKKPVSNCQFTFVKNIEATAIQNQGQIGKCWSFSSPSCFESELIKLANGKENNLVNIFMGQNII